MEQEPAVGDAIDGVIGEINADVDRLDLLIGRQNYRLAWWRAAERDLGYRRFFDVTSLIGIRIEDEQVFWEDHRLVLSLVRDGLVSGLRVDHPDGLRDPAQYLQRLREAAPDAWIVVEKILEPTERLRGWPVAGTTGYDFIRRVDALQVDPAGEEALTGPTPRSPAARRPSRTSRREGKDLAARELLGSELNRITARRARRLRAAPPLPRLHAPRPARGARASWRRASRSTDRTFGRSRGRSRPRTVPRSLGAIGDAQARRPDLPADLFDFLRQILSLEVAGDLETELVMRFQQLTGAVMAKGVEDTAFYRYARLLSLNEVGGDPGRFGGTVDGVPRRERARRRRVAGDACWLARPTTPSAARTRGPASRCSRRCRPSGRPRSTAGRTSTRSSALRRLARSQRRVLPLPDARRRVADLARSTRRRRWRSRSTR